MSPAALVLHAAFWGGAAVALPADAKPALRPDPPAPPLRVECEGQVTYRAGKDGRTRLVLTGGVGVTRGEMVLRARSAEAVLARGGTSPESVRVEGDVSLRSPTFSAVADVAEMRTVPAGPAAATVVDPGEPDAGRGEAEADAKEGERPGPTPAYEIRLERRELAEVELRAGDVIVACLGPLTYVSRSREARLTGGVRAESPRLRARCREAVVVLSERPSPPGSESGEGAGPEGSRPADAPGGAGIEADPETGEADAKGAEEKRRPDLPAVESVELLGDVVLDAPQEKGAAARRVRAAKALYSVVEGTVAFTGEPAPVVEYGGVTLTAPEIVLHLADNRIVPRGGKMKAVIGPAK